MTGVEVIPSAYRLIQSLRDLGYDFSQAVADVIDNSISARATRVDIEVTFDGDESWLRIADNGRGMDADQLRDAMRYGTVRDYSDVDLGKFGLGLKTASMSQCERLIVATRWNKDRSDVAAYAWDLAHVKKRDRWEILPVPRSDLPPEVDGRLRDGPGTVVIWERLDRIVGFKHPYGESARKRLAQMCRDLEAHLAMVFHEFLAGNVKGRRVAMTLNGHPIIPWDPFCREERKTTQLSPYRTTVEFEGETGEVEFEPFVLPHQADFSSPEAFRAAGGPANWNQQQGFYIYRGSRLIQSGGWSNLRAPDEHTKLARIAVRYPRNLDHAFGINVAKMRVQLPGSIRDDVRKYIGVVTKLAREVYDRKQRADRAGSASTTHKPQSENAKGGEHASNGRETTAKYTFREWKRLLLQAARGPERPIVEKVLNRIAEN